ncbi:2OG-Fe(II) oxygenase family protein [Halioglobus pacificus]|uniref:2-oxoglutarate-dependent ethylene/succinate-forming enzyme n=1 Tax=Parahalioglobus pacificus TaxID=930806 RepID=A0A918XE16_9GAMM|nr:2OG-Fe(II) oxygenase family protein [Halioglobus pacificus]GHD26653.1 oxidoreductase [Halioglobus pacificus]
MQAQAAPILDYSKRGQSEWVDSLDRACAEWGCFQLINHNLDSDLCASVLSAMQSFFALPLEAKLDIERTADNPWGFYDRELTKNVRDWKQIFDIGPGSAEGPFAETSTPWPMQLGKFQATMEAYYEVAEVLALQLLTDIGSRLSLPASALKRDFGVGHSSFLRLNYYPQCEAPEEHLGISHHTDAGALTVLLQDAQPGLQFWHGGDWHTVKAEPDALTINIGDIVQVWSNDRYRAPLHRVLTNKFQSRYSAPFFLNPTYDTVYAPLLSALNGEPPRYRSINWREFRAGRAAGDYADLGDEVQISDFRY